MTARPLKLPPHALAGVLACWLGLAAPHARAEEHAAVEDAPKPSTDTRSPPGMDRFRPPPTPLPWDGLGRSIVDAFSGTNLVLHGAAVGSTALMMFSGADHEVHVFVARERPLGDAVAQGAYWSGYFAGAAFSFALYGAGLASGRRQLQGAGAAAVQAVVLTSVTTGLLKVATGRPFPTHGLARDDPARLDAAYARELEPFRTDKGWAWPSGHTSSLVSVAAALTAYYPEKPWIPVVGYPIGLAVGLGMIEGEHHWASDVVAGALIGHAIGYSVGKNFRRRVREHREPTWIDEIQILPMLGTSQGLMIAARW